MNDGRQSRRKDSSNNPQNKMLFWVNGGHVGIYKEDATHIKRPEK